MAKSMTGFGRAEVMADGRKFTVEMKSVNNRYLEIALRMPKAFNPLEAKIRQELKNYMERGKVDVFIGLEESDRSDEKVVYNRALAGEYMEALKQISEEFNLPLSISAAQLANYPDVLTMQDVEEDCDLWTPLKEAIDEAAEQFAAARSREGEFLKNDLLAKLFNMSLEVETLKKRAPEIVAQYQESLTAKVKEMLGDASIDENRILQEVAVYSDHVCIDEEMVRLESHIAQMRDVLTRGGSVGRRLDFLAQEMNREANTTLSKAGDLVTADLGIAMKTDIEKIREQIQNLE